MAQLTDEVYQLRGELADHDKRLSVVETEVHGLHREIVGLRTEITGLKGDVKENTKAAQAAAQATQSLTDRLRGAWWLLLLVQSVVAFVVGYNAFLRGVAA